MNCGNRTKTLSALAAVAMATVVLTVATSSHAQLVSQFGILDLNANSGLNPATLSPWVAGDQYRLTFVSSTFRDPASGNIADYNTHVQNAANAAGLGSVTWNAIASTNVSFSGTATVDARDNTGTNPNIGTGVGIILRNGSSIIANNNADLWDGFINSPINRTESNGAYSPPGTSPFGANGGVWAGTDAAGVNRGVAALGGTRADLGLATATNSQWVRRADINPHNNAPLGLYAISDLLTVGGTNPAPPPVSLLSTDFAGRTVSGDTASNIPWVTNGIADPGDLTAAMNPDGLFDTANAQGHFAPNRNTGSEGPWSVDIPIVLTTPEIVIEGVGFDWQHFNDAGAFQTANRSVDWTATLIGSDSGVIAMDSILNLNGITGIEAFEFGGVTLTDDESWILQILAEGSNTTGNNTGLDAINVFGFINDAVVPEPTSIAIWSLIGLGLAGFGVYRARRKK